MLNELRKNKNSQLEASQLRTLYQLTELIKAYSIIDVNTNEEKTHGQKKNITKRQFDKKDVLLIYEYLRKC